MKFAVGMTTCRRLPPTIEESIRSVRRAGWSRVNVYAEPGSVETTDCESPVRTNEKTLGPWWNFYNGLAALVAEYPGAEAYLMLQDDVELANGLREYLERALWPGEDGERVGIVSLYTSSYYHRPDFAGWYKLEGRSFAYGALAYAMPPASARMLLGLVQRYSRESAGVDKKACGFFTGRGMDVWFHSPSLVRHTGHESTFSGQRITETRQCREFCKDAFLLPVTTRS